MKLTFPIAQFAPLLEEIETATQSLPFGDTITGTGFWLVADDGIYIMPNTLDGQHHKHLEPQQARLAVYATECDPSTMALAEWWEVKKNFFDGNDTIEFIPLSDVQDLVSDATKTNLLVWADDKTWRLAAE